MESVQNMHRDIEKLMVVSIIYVTHKNAFSEAVSNVNKHQHSYNTVGIPKQKFDLKVE